jgi:hypothetical protein
MLINCPASPHLLRTLVNAPEVVDTAQTRVGFRVRLDRARVATGPCTGAWSLCGLDQLATRRMWAGLRSRSWSASQTTESVLAFGGSCSGCCCTVTGRPKATARATFLRTDLRRHLGWYAEKGPDGMLFAGEGQAAPCDDDNRPSPSAKREGRRPRWPRDRAERRRDPVRRAVGPALAVAGRVWAMEWEPSWVRRCRPSSTICQRGTGWHVAARERRTVGDSPDKRSAPGCWPGAFLRSGLRESTPRS